MLMQPTLEKLYSMKLDRMAEAIRRQIENPESCVALIRRLDALRRIQWMLSIGILRSASLGGRRTCSLFRADIETRRATQVTTGDRTVHIPDINEKTGRVAYAVNDSTNL